MSVSLKGPQVPPLYDTLVGVKTETMKALRCCLPATISAIDTFDGTVNVNVAMFQHDTNGNPFPYPPLTKCPVITLQGGGVAAGFPITVGDQCLVFFSDRCIDNWLQTGTPQPLANFRMHDLSDGFVLVGVNSLNSLLNMSIDSGEGGIGESKNPTGAKVALNPTTHLITIQNGSQNLKLILSDLVTAVNALNGTLALMTTASIASLSTQGIIAGYTATFTTLLARLTALLY